VKFSWSFNIAGCKLMGGRSLKPWRPWIEQESRVDDRLNAGKSSISQRLSFFLNLFTPLPDGLALV